jgi:predicted nucleotidyltransferase
MNDAEIVRIIRQAVPDAIAIYRFGSTASGQTHAESDVDLAFLAPRELDPVRRFELQEQLAAALRAASTVMRMQVVSHGALLFASDAGEADRFADYVFSAYARLNEERKAILEQVRREGTVYGR